MIEEWIYKGNLDDIYSEFFIQQKEIKNNLKCNNLEHFHNTFTINQNKKVKFIPEECYIQIFICGIYNYYNFRYDNFSLPEEFKEEILKFELGSFYYIKFFNSLIQKSSKLLKEYCLVKEDFLSQLR